MQLTAVLATIVKEKNMIGEHTSYHQGIGGEEARRRLNQKGSHCYLTRYSKKNKCYVLSVYEDRLPPMDPVVEHFKIVVNNTGKLKIGEKEQTFDDIESLLRHYEKNRINPDLRSIGEPYTEKDYEKKQKEIQERERQEEEERKRREQERERREQEERERREREERERREQEERERREREERERRERERREQEEKERRERERKWCNIL
jgi:hypothetical protein